MKILTFAQHMIFGEQKYDAAIAFRSGLCTELVGYSVNSAKKITWWHHGEYNLSEAGTKAYREIGKRMSHVIAVSESCAYFLKEHFPELSDKIRVIPNMVPVKEVQIRAEQFQPYNHESLLKIVSVGRLSPEKHMENCVYAAQKLLDIESFQWIFVGDGPERHHLEKQVADNNLQDHVVFVGSQSNPYPYIKNADLFVHSSYVESQGLVVLEAMALGIPCVVTKSLGPCEYIKDGINGVLTEQSKEALAEDVIKVIRDRELYQFIRKNTACPEQFMPKVIMNQIESLLEEELL